MSEPSIKGMMLQGTVDRLHEHLDAGKLPPDKLEQRLDVETLEVVNGAVNMAGWYPVRVFEAIAELTIELDDRPRREACVDAGALDARRIIESGIYAQLDLVNRGDQVRDSADDRARFDALGELLRFTMGLSKGFWNFGEWTPIIDPDHERRYRVDVTDAEHYPECAALGTMGFLNECSRTVRPGTKLTWLMDRPRADLLYYRMDRNYY